VAVGKGWAMVKRGQHDPSPGDRRQPFSDEGGPEGRHARTHDVARERATRPTGPGDADDEFADDLAPLDVPGSPAHRPGHAEEAVSAVEIKELHDLDLRKDELGQLQVLSPGAHLEQGGVYIDLDDLARGEFTAASAQEVVDGRYVAKRDTDHELWNRLLGRQR
jgi:hypothetical protein